MLRSDLQEKKRFHSTFRLSHFALKRYSSLSLKWKILATFRCSARIRKKSYKFNLYHRTVFSQTQEIMNVCLKRRFQFVVEKTTNLKPLPYCLERVSRFFRSVDLRFKTTNTFPPAPRLNLWVLARTWERCSSLSLRSLKNSGIRLRRMII